MAVIGLPLALLSDIPVADALLFGAALSAALLLSLPANYAHRHVFLCIAFVLIFFTLTVNPLLLRARLKRKPLD